MLIDEGMPASEVQNLCDVHVAVMRDALDKTEAPDTISGHPIHSFRAENDAAGTALDNLRDAWNTFKAQPDQVALQGVQEQVEHLRMYNKHFLRLENLLFSYLERYDFYGPSQVMWQTHDQIREQWKSLLLQHTGRR